MEADSVVVALRLPSMVAVEDSRLGPYRRRRLSVQAAEEGELWTGRLCRHDRAWVVRALPLLPALGLRSHTAGLVTKSLVWLELPVVEGRRRRFALVAGRRMPGLSDVKWA